MEFPFMETNVMTRSFMQISAPKSDSPQTTLLLSVVDDYQAFLATHPLWISKKFKLR
jgi:hypothetical protein